MFILFPAAGNALLGSLSQTNKPNDPQALEAANKRANNKGLIKGKNAHLH
jgi:hypothetical protein